MKWTKCLLATVLVSTAYSSMADVPKNLDVINEQADLMADVLTKSINSNQSIVRRVSSTYLLNQGLMFEFQLVGSRGMRFFNPIGHVPEPPEVEELQYVVEEAMEAAMVGLEEAELDFQLEFQRGDEEYAQMMEKLHLLREKERELNREVREIKREQIRAKEEDKKRLEQKKVKIERDEESLKKEQQKVKEKLTKFKEEKRKRKAEAKAKQEEAWKDTVVKAEQELMEGLCSFGGGLRPLPKDQYATFIFKQGSMDRKKDKVYVLKRGDIMDCVTGEIDGKGLLSKSEQYFF